MSLVKRSHHFSVGGDDTAPVKKVRTVNEELRPLTRQQQRILDVVMSGKNVFYTGAAGTGKSFLATRIIEELKKKEKRGMFKKLDANGNPAKWDVWVCASTGTAAVRIGGSTLHHCTGLGTMAGKIENVGRYMSKNKRQDWLELDALFLDEVSMTSCAGLTFLDQAAKKLRKNNKPFGGIQVIMTGDFFQLPPVRKLAFNEIKGTREEEAEKDNCYYAFCSPVWDEAFGPHQYTLTTIFRQKDESFARVLNHVRMATFNQEVMDFINNVTVTEFDFTKFTHRPTILFTTNAPADEMNKQELTKLVNAAPIAEREEFVHIYHAEDSEGTTPQDFRDLLAEDAIELCIGCLVICIANLDVASGICNGTRGFVQGFACDENDESGRLYPIVDFVIGETQRVRRVMGPCTWRIEKDKSEDTPKLTRTQIPLRLAWALTIHKSQGMTIDNLAVDLSKKFSWGNVHVTAGQVYVALSRATNMNRLQIKGFNPQYMKTSRSVIEFYSKLEKNMDSL